MSLSIDHIILDRNKIMQVFENNSDKLRVYGIKQIGLFGSYARDEQKEDSDVDIIVDFEEGKLNFRNYMGLALFLEDLLNKRVDLVIQKDLREEIRPNVMEDVKYAPIQ